MNNKLKAIIIILSVIAFISFLASSIVAFNRESEEAKNKYVPYQEVWDVE